MESISHPRNCQSLVLGSLFLSLVLSASWALGNTSTPSPAENPPTPGLGFKVKPATEFDRLFRQKDGWIGGDAACSSALGKGRILWLFGDSLIGTVRHGKRQIDSMVNNTVAIQSDPNPTTASIRFFHGGDKSHPSAFIRPEKGAGWFWLSGGTIRNSKGLYLFMPRIVNTPGPQGWNFRVQGMTLGKVSNPDDDPLDWKIQQFEVPCFRNTSREEWSFGACVIRDGAWFYIYGFGHDKNAGNRHLLLARSREENLERFSSWEFLSHAGWQRDFKKATALADHIGTEFSVSWLPGANRYVLVSTENGLSEKIIMRSALSPEGPWSNAATICRTREPHGVHGTFCYAAKAHPELARRADELIVSYVRNASDLGALNRWPGIYTPKFLRVSISGDRQIP